MRFSAGTREVNVTRLFLLSTFALMIVVTGCVRNNPPEIVAVKAFQETVLPNDSVELIVTATDPENSPLKFQWQAAAGKLANDRDSVVKWYAPDKPGKVKVTVRVSDKKGAAVTRSLELQVAKPTQIYTGSLGPESDRPRPPKTERVNRPTRKNRGAEPSTPREPDGRRRSRRGSK